MLLDATTKTIEVLLGGAVTTSQLPVVVSYVDIDGSGNVTGGENDTATNNTTAVTALAAPASGHQRSVENFSVYNKDTASATVTVRVNNNGTLREMKTKTLAAGESLVWTRSRGWL